MIQSESWYLPVDTVELGLKDLRLELITLPTNPAKEESALSSLEHLFRWASFSFH
jgi:hypothetical protein